MSRAKLSVVIITLNEEENLPRCLASIKKIADEIVLVDSGSKDKTISIARSWGARVFIRPFDNFANQRNFALEKARGTWILSVDADETVTKSLAKEIKKAICSDRFDAYSIPRKNIIFGKFIKHTRWQPELDRHIWLFKKEKGRWVGDVHEEVEVQGKVSKLNSAKIHYQYKTVSEFFEMMNRYSEMEAEEKFRKGIKFSYFRLFYDPLYNFLVRFFYRLGFLDGWRGFVLSYLMAIYHLQVWAKIWERQNKK